jgi:adenosine deaminase
MTATPAANPGLYAELHLHLGGAILPHILYVRLQRDGHPLLKRYPTFERFEKVFTKRRHSLADYLKMHELVEHIQQPADPTLYYFVTRLVRGAYLFDNLAYIELRHTPYNRTDAHWPQSQRIDQMRSVVEVVAAAASAQSHFPVRLSQILCTHSRLPYAVNKAIVDLAGQMRDKVCGIDLAGPDVAYADRMGEFVKLFRHARKLGLKTTAHLYETADGCHPELLPYLDRIGHGIQIPLRHPHLLKAVARRGQCLEVCPTTYLRTGTLKAYTDLRDVFLQCRDAGVPVALCTDNGGLHGVRLPHEYENLLLRDVITFEQLQECRQAAFDHAFAWAAG